MYLYIERANKSRSFYAHHCNVHMSTCHLCTAKIFHSIVQL